MQSTNEIKSKTIQFYGIETVLWMKSKTYQFRQKKSDNLRRRKKIIVRHLYNGTCVVTSMAYIQQCTVYTEILVVFHERKLIRYCHIGH